MDTLHITTSVRIYPLILKTCCVLWFPSCAPWSPQAFTKDSRGCQEKRRDIWQTPDLLQDLNFIQRPRGSARPEWTGPLCLFSLAPFMCVFVRTKSQDKKRWKTKAVRSPGSSLIIITSSNLLWGPWNSILNSPTAFN